MTDGERGFFLKDTLPYSNSGTAVGSADVNKDGISDIIIGASRANFGMLHVGTASVVFGSRNILAWGTASYL